MWVSTVNKQRQASVVGDSSFPGLGRNTQQSHEWKNGQVKSMSDCPDPNGGLGSDRGIQGLPSLTRQLAFGELDDEKGDKPVDYSDYRSNMMAKIATFLILGVTVLLFIVFFFKNKQLEQRFHESSPSTLSPSEIPPSPLDLYLIINATEASP